MNKKITIGLAMMFCTVIFAGLAMQLSEIDRYLCIPTGHEYTMTWYGFINGGTKICIIISIIISVVFLGSGIAEKKTRDE